MNFYQKSILVANHAKEHNVIIFLDAGIFFLLPMYLPDLSIMFV